MKKIFLLSVLLSGIAHTANATHVFNGNPMYHPGQGTFYNVLSPVNFDTKFERFVMADEFGYGVTDFFTVLVQTSGAYDSSDNPEFGKWAWNNLAIGFDWAIDDIGGYHTEVFGSLNQIYDMRHDFDIAGYNWTLGTRVGQFFDDWTIAGVVLVEYLYGTNNPFNYDAWGMSVGLEGQYVLNSQWNVVADLMFNFDLFDDYYDYGEQLVLGVGINYNFDASKYIGLRMGKDWVHSFDRAPMEFEINFGMEF